MANAGTVTIDFAAETAKFTAELKKVRADIRSLKDDTKKLADGFETAWKTITGVVTSAVIAGGIRAMIKATEESEQAISQLNNALKNAGANASVVSEDFQAFATEMQRVSTFSDEAIIGVETLLLGFRGLSSGTIKQATADILDLSVRLGIDLNTAAKTVGRALEAPVAGMTALRKAGIQFSDDQKRVIKDLVETGDKANAQQIILKELEARGKGAAAALRDTLGGALQAVKNSFDDLLEAKGGMPGATSALNELANTLQSEDIKKGFEALTTGLAKVIELTAKGAAGLASFGSTAGNFLGRLLVPESELTAVQALTKELEREEQILRTLRGRAAVDAALGVHELDERISKEQAYIETLKQRIELLKEGQPKRDFISSLVPAADSIIGQITTPNSDFVTPDVTGESDEALKKREEQFKEHQAFLRRASDETNAIVKANIADQVAFEDEQYREFGLRRLEVQQIAYDAERDAALQASLSRQEIAQQERDFLILMDQEVIAQRQRTVNSAVNLLQILAQRSKTAAVALIAVNRGLQIAHAIQNTSSAVMNAMANVPYPANLAAAAQIKLMGALEIATIAGTGALEVGAVTSGRGASVVGPGTPNNPIFTDSGNEEDRQFGASSRSVVQINFEGMVTEAAARQIAEMLGEIVKDSDVVFIPASSRQGQVLSGQNG